MHLPLAYPLQIQAQPHPCTALRCLATPHRPHKQDVQRNRQPAATASESRSTARPLQVHPPTTKTPAFLKLAAAATQLVAAGAGPAARWAKQAAARCR